MFLSVLMPRMRNFSMCALVGFSIAMHAQETAYTDDCCADVDEALSRLGEQKSTYLCHAVENLRGELRVLRGVCRERLSGYLCSDRPIFSLEWVGGFQGGYNTFVLTEQSAFMSRIDVSGRQMILGFPMVQVTNLLARICDPKSPLTNYTGGAPVQLAFDIPVLFGKFSWKNNRPCSVVTYYPRKSPVAPGQTDSKMLNGYFEIAEILQMLDKLIQEQEFVIFYRATKEKNGESIVPTYWFSQAFH